MFKSLFLLTVVGVALGSARPAAAQVASAAARPASTPAGAAPTSVEARAEALTTNMTQALALTPAQVEKVRAINLAAVRSVEAARVRYRQDPAKLKGYVDDIGLARLDRLKDVLTSVQFARYQQKREEKMGIPTIRGNQGNPPPGLPSRGDE
ncbi:hypothetical protein [Hymenobacter baengnokdamensis]|uniref:hypothetical protein n=1 Tax=Hymenobacter baengnokdamensis TaxID=2615203 RepID=UPI0012452ABC|nr:hypothetical protein [Hymenobacter baengnokdamensis]